MAYNSTRVMKNSKLNIEELVERWLDGATTLDEERTLADYFEAGNVADNLRWAEALFARNAQARTTTPATPIVPTKTTPGRRTLRLALVATASVAAAMALGLFGVSHTQKQACAYINGQMVCDAAVAMEYAAPVFERVGQSLQPLHKTRENLSKVKTSTDKATAIIEKYNVDKLLQL